MSLDKFGTDEWVARIDERQRKPTTPLEKLVRLVTSAWQRLPLTVRFALVAVVLLSLPLLTRSDYVLRLGTLVVLYAALAIGLNISIGYIGLLDLGYIGFFGIGGYTYAFLSSDQLGVHWPTIASLLAAVFIVFGIGFLIGLPSLRLRGDYLAIVTLGFGQIFVQLMTAMNRVSLPWLEQPVNVTGGPNGINNIDALQLFNGRVETVTAAYYVFLLTLAVILLVVYRINQSRLGRAWRAIREDGLAADVMGIPASRLRLFGFALAAALAGLIGALFAAWQGSVFPNNFDVTLLITLYAMVVLGGVGSLPGMVIGALLISVFPELIRPGTQIAGIEISQLVFYGGIGVALWILVRPRWRILLILAALIIGGVAVRVLVQLVAPGVLESGGDASNIVRQWLAIPGDTASATYIGNLAFFLVVGLIVLLIRLPKRWRSGLLVGVLYLLTLTWETRLSQEPSTTRLLLVGVLLIVLMNFRPQGLFGKKQVEIV